MTEMQPSKITWSLLNEIILANSQKCINVNTINSMFYYRPFYIWKGNEISCVHPPVSSLPFEPTDLKP